MTQTLAFNEEGFKEAMAKIDSLYQRVAHCEDDIERLKNNVSCKKTKIEKKMTKFPPFTKDGFEKAIKNIEPLYQRITDCNDEIDSLKDPNSVKKKQALPFIARSKQISLFNKELLFTKDDFEVAESQIDFLNTEVDKIEKEISYLKSNNN